MNTPPNTKPTNPLVQKALERLIAICKGNGINTKNITVSQADVQDVHFSAGTFFELTVTSQDKVLAGRQQAGETVADPRDVERIMREMTTKAQGNKTLEQALTQQLQARKDKGFMLEGAMLPVAGMERTVSWHEPCTTCQHTGHVRCDQCNGQKYARCQQCHGQTMMKCPLCLGTGHIAGQRGQQPCNKCNGMRRVPCTVCRRTGKIPCQKCRATGQATCPTCKGQAFSTRVVTLSMKAQTRADYARTMVPEYMTFLIENNGPALVANGDIIVSAQSMQDEGKMGVHYEADCAYADITFRLGNKPVKVGAYGKGNFVRLPPILDSLLTAPIDQLNLAAHGTGDVAKLLKDAGRYRAIALALVTTIRANAAQTSARLMEKYPEGLSRECAAKIGKYADAAVGLITRKPRYQGLMIGLALVGLLYAFYYVGPGRSLLMPFVGNIYLRSVIDVLLVILGAMMTTLSIQISAKNALHKALGHLVPPNKRRSLIPRARGAGLWGYGAGFVLYMIAVELSRHVTGGSTPSWYQSALALFGIQ